MHYLARKKLRIETAEATKKTVAFASSDRETKKITIRTGDFLMECSLCDVPVSLSQLQPGLDQKDQAGWFCWECARTRACHLYGVSMVELVARLMLKRSWLLRKDWIAKAMQGVFDDPPDDEEIREAVSDRVVQKAPELLDLCIRYYVGEDHRTVSEEFAPLLGWLEDGKERSKKGERWEVVYFGRETDEGTA